MNDNIFFSLLLVITKEVCLLVDNIYPVILHAGNKTQMSDQIIYKSKKQNF